MAKNAVVAGDYFYMPIKTVGGMVKLQTSAFKHMELNKTTVSQYELITEEHRKSAISGVSRGLVGGALLGPVGLLAGLSAKNKSTHTLAIEFTDGKRSLIEIDDKIYKSFIQRMF